MIPIKPLLLTFFLLSTLFSFAQQITNVSYPAPKRGEKSITITYTISDTNPQQRYKVQLFCSFDEGETYKTEPLYFLEPEDNTNVAPGTHRVKWLAVKEYGKFTGYLKFRIEATPLYTNEQLLWQAAQNTNTCDSYNQYLQQYPNGKYAAPAKTKTEELCKSPFTNYTETATGVPFDMVAVKGGTFKIGSTDGASDETPPPYNITLNDFYMAKTEVTNAEYAAFLNAKGNQKDPTGIEWINLSGRTDAGMTEKCRIQKSGSIYVVESGYEEHPVIYVSWYGSKAYIEWLNQKTTGKQYRLPSEAEWEYAAGNGAKKTKYSWGNNDPQGKNGGNVADQSAKRKFSGWTIFENYDDGYVLVAPVKKFNANEYGLHDMSGNVWEWCEDDWHNNYNGIPKDGKAWTENPRGSYRVYRGGSWINGANLCRVAYRYHWNPYDRNYYLGFRLVRSPQF